MEDDNRHVLAPDLADTEKSALLAELLSCSHHDFVFLDSTMTIKAASPGFAEATMSVQSALGHRLDLVCPQTAKSMEPLLNDARTSRRAFVHHGWQLTPTGEALRRNIMVRPIYSQDGEFLGWILGNSGCSNAEDDDLPVEAAKEQGLQALSRETLDCIPVGIGIISPQEDAYEFMNLRFRSFLKSIGETKAAMLPRLAEESALNNRQLSVCIKSNNSHDAYGFYDVDFIPSDQLAAGGKATSRRGVAIIVHDITERVQFLDKQKALAETTDQLNQETNMQNAMDIVVSRVADTLHADYCCLLVRESEEPSVLLRMAQWGSPGLVPEYISLSDSPSLTSAVRCRRTQYYLRQGADDSESLWLEQMELWGALAVPLHTRGLCIGVICAFFKAKGYVPASEDIHFAELIAEQTSVLLDRDKVLSALKSLLEAEQAAREAAQHQSNQVHALLESLEDGVAVFDKYGRLLLANKAAEQIIGVCRGNIKSINDVKLLKLETGSGTPVAASSRPYSILMSGNRLANCEYVVKCLDDAERIISFTGGVVKSDDGQITSAIITFRDVTSIRHLEQAKDNYLRIVSHDLRSPLTLILARAQIIDNAADNIEMVRKSAKAIVKSARQMNTMISDLTDSVRLETGQLRIRKEPMNIADMLRDIADRSPDMPSGKHVLLEIEEGLPMVVADPARVEQILVNLASNAFKYSGDADSITVSAFITGNGSEVGISVTDTGIGIAPEDVPRLFERYFRAESARERTEGLGLGLFITKGLVEALGGRIWVNSTPGQGSSFTFTLPVADV